MSLWYGTLEHGIVQFGTKCYGANLYKVPCVVV